MERKLRLANSEKPSLRETPSTRHSNHTYTRLNETRRKQECIPTAKSLCHTADSAKHSDVMVEQSSCHSREQHNNNEGSKIIEHRVSNVKTYNIPRITLPSLPFNKVMRYYKVSVVSVIQWNGFRIFQ